MDTDKKSYISKLEERDVKKEHLNLSENLELCKEKKDKTVRLHNILMELRDTNELWFTDKYLKRIKDCGSYLEFLANKDFSKTKLFTANFCHNRFCPNCAYRKYRKEALELAIVMKYLDEEYDYKYLFLTLTAPNVKGDQLKDELKDYSESFKRMFERKAVKKVNKGYVRKLEITYNEKTKTYHPHYHILMAVDKNYNSDNKDLYLHQKEWLELWRQSKRDDSILIVDIREIKNKEKAILELTKYLAKDSNYLINAEVFKIFWTSLRRVRAYSFNGVFKEARKLYKNNELDRFITKDTVLYVYILVYMWSRSDGKYKNESLRYLFSGELIEFNKDVPHEEIRDWLKERRLIHMRKKLKNVNNLKNKIVWRQKSE